MTNSDSDYVCIPYHVAMALAILFVVFSQSRNFVLTWVVFSAIVVLMYTVVIGDIVIFGNSLTDTFMLSFITEPINFLEMY